MITVILAVKIMRTKFPVASKLADYSRIFKLFCKIWNYIINISNKLNLSPPLVIVRFVASTEVNGAATWRRFSEVDLFSIYT